MDYRYMHKINNEYMNRLSEAVLCLNSIEECKQFFSDLCSKTEINTMAVRFEVARLLSEHHVYNNIVLITGASSATISRVNRSLYDGNGGYAMIFERMKNKNSRRFQTDITSGLFQALLYLNSVEECYIFFGDLCTNLEINTMSQRFEVARLLYNGCLYNDIVSRTGASTATISRVNRSLKDNTNGYINALRHLYPIDENKK